MDLNTIADHLSAVLNERDVDLDAPSEADGVVKAYLRENGDVLEESQRDVVTEFYPLFWQHPFPRNVAAPEDPRFAEGVRAKSPRREVWELAVLVSDRLTQPVLAAFLDDVILTNAEAKGPVRTVTGFSFKSQYERTVRRYIRKVTWIRGLPEETKFEFKDLALSDAVQRAADLSSRYSDTDGASAVLPLIKELAVEFHGNRSWRWLWPMLEAFTRIATSHRLPKLEVPDSEIVRFRDYAKDCAQGFAEPGGLFHLIPDTNALVRMLDERHGNANAVEDELRSGISLAEKVAAEKATSKGKIVAAAILDQAIVLAKRLRDSREVARLSSIQVKYREDAFRDGEFKEHEHKFEIPRANWERFLAPFDAQSSPETALQLWIEHPAFVPDFVEMKKHAAESGSILASLFSPSVIGGIGLQIAGEGEKRTGRDIHLALNVTRMFQLTTGMFLAPTLRHIVEKHGVTKEIALDKVRSWALLHPDSVRATTRGIECFFEGDYVSAIYILAPQFEALLRRAFHVAGISHAIDTHYSEGEGISQQERMLGSFLGKDEVREALGNRVATYFSFVFTNEPGDGLMGLNLRNKVAHGIIEPGLLDETNAALLLHCVLFLTTLTTTEE